MPRSRNFDESTVIDAAVNVFWRGGLGTTSIDDLLCATGLSRSSLYNAFGSKDQILGRIIHRYADMQLHALELAFRQGTLRQSLTRLFDDIALDNNDGKGCLLVKGINELHYPEADALDAIRAGFSRIADKLSELVYANVLRHTWRPIQRVAGRSDARPVRAAMAAPLASGRNAPGGRPAARPKGAPECAMTALQRLPRQSALPAHCAPLS